MTDPPRLILVSGKGGTGKSAMTAALAIAHHRQGRRVLAIDVAAGGGLAAHLGVDRLEFAPRELGPGLHALAIDRSRALVEYLKVQLGIPGLATLGPLARLFDTLASTAPGVREVVTLGKVMWEARQDSYDVIVSDCPPTGQIAGLLRAPTTISDLVPAGRIRRQAEWMTEMLIDPTGTHLILVTLAEELPVIETQETLAAIAADNLVGKYRVVTNRVLDPLRTKAMGTGAGGEAAALHRGLYAHQQEWLGQLPPERTFPYLFGLLTPGEVAARLADLWEDE
ncbi:MAG: ArsA family ATPase [Actinomycetota bacterium]